MARRTLPLGITCLAPEPNAVVVGAVPTRDTQRRHGTGGLTGLFTTGNLADVIPVQHPISPLDSAAFPYLKGSDVAPNYIRTVIMTAINLFPAQRHSKAQSVVDSVVPATAPDPSDVGWNMPKKQGRGTGGHYTLPAPPNIPNWPIFIDRLPR